MTPAPHRHAAAPWTCQASSRADERRLLVDAEHQGAGGRRERDRRRERLRERVVVGDHDGPGHEAQRVAPADREPDEGASAGRGAGAPASTIAPAEQPATTAPRAWAARSARAHAAVPRARRAGGRASRPTGRRGRPRRSLPRQPGRSRPRRRVPGRGSTSAPSAAKWASPCAAQRRNVSSPSGHDAVGRTTTRGRARPVASRRPGRPPPSTAVNSPDPTSAIVPSIGGESTRWCP